MDKASDRKDLARKEFELLLERLARISVTLSIIGLLGACGTTYELPDVAETEASRARVMFSQAQSQPPRRASSNAVAEQRFYRVVNRVKPVAEQICVVETSSDGSFDCNARFEIDRKSEVRNAYFSYGRRNIPTIAFTMPLLQDAQNDDEIAFIMGHEYGHLIAKHIQKQQQQMVAGMLIMGALTAVAQANNPYADPGNVSRNMELGGAMGSRAFSQSYELESDVLGTRITEAAGYDAIKGARYFARPEAAKTRNGNLSFWGTHPPDEDRLAIVLATKKQLDGGEALRRRPE